MATADDLPGDEAALRGEHDGLLARLSSRASVDAIRSAAYRGFSTLLAFGLTVKFAWDRWGWSELPKPPPRDRFPLLVVLGLAVFLLLLALTVTAIRRARAHRAVERGLVARFAELRRILRLDP